MRLVVDGRGTERVVEKDYVPPTPEENIIVFPDKKERRVDWRLTLERIQAVTDILLDAEFVQEEGTFNVPIDRPDIPFVCGFVMSDSHIGSNTTDHKLVVRFIDTVLQTPNSFLVDDGDTFDNGIWGGMQWQQLIPPYLQAFTIKDMMRELGEKYAACVLGNHTEWMFNSAGVKPEVLFAEQMSGPIFPGMGLLHLFAGDVLYDFALSHSYWGKSKKNIFNVCVNLRSTEYPRADIFVVGHEHIRGFMTEYVDDRKVIYIRPGTAKVRDRYARIHGIARRGQEWGVGVILSTKEKWMSAVSIKDAVRFMQMQHQLVSA